MATFKDNFSKQSDIYVKYRPLYPLELYAYLSSLTPEHKVAWDCGTGNGQAAIGLAEFFDQIIATDPSEQQIGNSLKNQRIKYCVEKAENSSVETNSIDLLTVANALHWFDFNTFYTEAKRVLKTNGIIAAWAYGNPEISSEIDPIINHFHDFILKDYWLAENRLVENEYKTIPFPFEEIDSPSFYYKKPMALNGLIGLLNTWSATQRFIDKNGFSPTEQLNHELLKIWNDGSEKIFTWKLILKVGKH
jgi:SAM-dependent methyltransferase